MDDIKEHTIIHAFAKSVSGQPPSANTKGITFIFRLNRSMLPYDKSLSRYCRSVQQKHFKLSSSQKKIYIPETDMHFIKIKL